MTQYSVDGRYIIVAGRRRRATDPGIPEPLRLELVGVLMCARRGLAGSAERPPPDEVALRSQVHDAKLALGERGAPWWDDPDDDELAERAQATIRTLTRARQHPTVTAKEIAQVLSGRHWRGSMDLAQRVVRSVGIEPSGTRTARPLPGAARRPIAGALAPTSSRPTQPQPIGGQEGPTAPSGTTNESAASRG